MRRRSGFVLLLGSLLLAGCAADPSQGYSTGGFFGDESRSVSAPIFGNQTFYEGLEFDLSEALVKEIQKRTPWAVTRSGSASTELTGTIVAVEQIPLSAGRRTGLVDEVALRISIDFTWRDARTGDELVSRRNFAASGTFVPARAGGAERIEVGQTGAIATLAREVVDEMRNQW